MSGSTIGSFVGAGIGFLVGGPAGARIGWMAGGLIGGLIAPEKIKGPRLTDARSQTAQDGVPRTYGYGTFPTTGNILWRDPTINEVETSESGKGGPKQISYTYTRSYAIGVCRGPIAGFLIIKRNGKIVYDARPDSELLALGYTSAQISETRAAQAKWLEVATFYLGDDDQLPDPTIQAVKGAGNVPAYRGSAYIVCTDDDVTELQGAVPQYEFVVSACGTQSEVAGGNPEIVEGFDSIEFRFECNPANWEAVGYCAVPSVSDESFTLTGDGSVVYDVTLAITGSVESKDYSGGTPVDGEPRFLLGGTEGPLLPDYNSYYIEISNPPQRYWMNRTTTGTSERYTFTGELLNVQIASDATVTMHAESNDGYQDPPSQWMRATVAGTTTGTTIPDAPGHYVDPITGEVTGPGGTQVERCLVTLGDIVEDQCAVRSVTTVDVSELTDDVDGLRVASETSPQRNIQALQVGYFFDGCEYDGVLHFPKRGASATFALTWDDFVSRDGDPVEWEVTKENELLRKVTVGYIDPATTYTPTTQNWERRAGTIAAQGEGTIDLAVTGNKDWAKQAAEKHLKAAWAETKECKFSLSIAHAALVTGEVGTIPSSEGGEHLIRITRIEDDGDVRHITARKTQPGAYDSTATGVTINPPRFPGSGLSGPALSAVMNLPVLRDADDKAGVYWAATGPLSGWPGAVLTLSRDGVTFENGPQITVPCTMGVLTAALPEASRYGLDTVNTLSVRLYPGAKDLANASYDDLIETEVNAFAILYADGTAEIGQFTARTVTGAREYDLTGLLRGRNDTTPGPHAEGAIFVLLDENIRFVAIKPSDVGKTLTFRAVSFGTLPEANAAQTITMTTIESLREWSPYNVTVESDGAEGYCVEWIGRARLGSSLVPIHSQWFAGYRVTFDVDGVTHDVDTTNQALCITAAEMTEAFGSYGWPGVTVRAISRIATNDDDFDSPASPPPVTGTPVAITPSGAPASPSLGPNGGYPDNAPYPVPEPTTFGTDVVEGGGFTGAGDLSKWRDASGAPLDARWSIVSGRLCFFGTGSAAAYNWDQRRTLAQQLLPHYSYDVAADVESDAGAMGSIGVGLGFSTGGTSLTASTDLDSYLERPMSVPAEYGEPTAVTHSYADKRDSYGITAKGQTVVTIVAPAVLATVTGPAARVYFDNVEMEVTENAPATTPIWLTNLDFASGLTGWVQFPPASGVSPSPTVSGGEVTFTPVSEYGVHKYLICEDPITDLDTLDKWLELMAEVKCNDPTVFSGMTRGGVGLQIAVSLDAGATYNYTSWANPVERGDWTARKRWIRQTFMTGGLTFHVCILFKCALGYSASVRNITGNVTTGPVT